MNLTENIIYFIIAFILIFACHLGINIWRFKKKKSILGDSYVIGKFKLDRKRLNKKKTMVMVSLINSFIIAFVAIGVSVISIQMIWQLLIATVLLFGLIYSIYEIYGRYLVKKGFQKKKGDKNV